MICRHLSLITHDKIYQILHIDLTDTGFHAGNDVIFDDDFGSNVMLIVVMLMVL